MASTTLHFQLSTLHSFGALDFATIRITCDGPSDLGDHVIIARTNQVCHVPLLAGATYAVESDLPIAYSAVSSEHAHIVTNSITNLTASLPLEFSVERIQMRDGSGASNYGVRSLPINVYPDVSAVTGGCCTVTGARRVSRGRVRGIAAAQEGAIRSEFPRHGKDTASYSLQMPAVRVLTEGTGKGATRYLCRVKQC